MLPKLRHALKNIHVTWPWLGEVLVHFISADRWNTPFVQGQKSDRQNLSALTRFFLLWTENIICTIKWRHPQSDRHFAIKNKLFIVTDALHTYGETIAETNKRSIFFRRKVHQWTQHTAGQSTVTDFYLFCNFRALKPAANAEMTSLWFQRLKNSIYQSELFMIMLYEYVTYSWRISRVQVRGLKARLLLCHRILRSRKYSYCENKTTSIIEEIYWKKFDLKHMKKERKKYAAQHTVSVHLNKS